MRFLALTLLLGTIAMINGEIRSLKYIYTALSKTNVEGVHDFTAMGLLDHRQVDYFDSVTQTKVARKPWMIRELGQEYFDKGTLSRRNKMQWFKVNLGILMKRMKQNDSDVHVLQWQHGCDVDLQPDGKDTFIRGVDRYSYDGDDFLDYDSRHDVWVSTMVAAKSTKDKWNGVKQLISYTDGYLKNECMKWLKDFSEYEAKEPSKDKTELHIFSKKSLIGTNHVLTCLATGLPSKNFSLEIRRNDRVLDKADGLKSSGLRPNEDETFQRRHYVELLRTDKASYSCHLSKPNLQKNWDGKLPPKDSNIGIIAAVVGVLLVFIGLAAVAVVFIVRKKRERVFQKVPLRFEGPPPPEKKPDDPTLCSIHLPDEAGKPLLNEKECSGLFGSSGDSGVSGSNGSTRSVTSSNSSDTAEPLLNPKGRSGSFDSSGDCGASGSNGSVTSSNSSDTGHESPDSGAGSSGTTPPSEPPMGRQ